MVLETSRGHRRTSTKATGRILPISLFIVSIVAIYLILFNNGNSDHHQRYLSLKLRGLGIKNKKVNAFELTNRVKSLIQGENGIIGSSLKDVKTGSVLINTLITGHNSKEESNNNKSPMKLEEIIDFLTTFLHQLHDLCLANRQATFKDIWKIYHDLATETLYPWDQEYLKRMPERRRDGTIFLGLASYRDENCLPTLKNAYAKAKNPEKLFVGLVQQNCESNCRTGVLSNLKMELTEPDEDCHQVYCASPEGKVHCDAGRVRALHVNETESLGPYAARYFGSKLWYGEEWFMQIDSHMTFAQNWDALSIEMLENAPSKKPVISHYPPSEDFNFEKEKNSSAARLCGGIIAESDLESQIVRLQVTVNDKGKKTDTPKFNPVIAAGYFVASSEFLSEVPYDPFLPWIFMGEEIIMSARMWTHGYDIFSPSQNVVGHIYFRRHKPKFWESVHRVFHNGVHNPLQMMILNRVKHQIGYPEASRDMIHPTLLSKVEDYSLGTKRSLNDYLKVAGYDFYYKLAVVPDWCANGVPPPIPEYEKYRPLYPAKQ